MSQCLVRGLCPPNFSLKFSLQFSLEATPLGGAQCFSLSDVRIQALLFPFGPETPMEYMPPHTAGLPQPSESPLQLTVRAKLTPSQAQWLPLLRTIPSSSLKRSCSGPSFHACISRLFWYFPKMMVLHASSFIASPLCFSIIFKETNIRALRNHSAVDGCSHLKIPAPHPWFSDAQYNLTGAEARLPVRK